MTDEERALLDWQQDRHTPIQYATGFTDEELEVRAFQKAIDEDCGHEQPLEDFLAGEAFPCDCE